MSKRRKPKLFELGDQWIDVEADRPGFYRYWFDAAAGRVCRARLTSEDLETAKLELAQLIITGAPKTHASYLSTILDGYFSDVTDAKPSKEPASRAGAVILQFFESERGNDVPRISDLDVATQQELIAWCAREPDLEHAVKTISRNMSVLSAALRHAGIKDLPVIYSPAKVTDALEKKRAPVRESQRRFLPTDAELARFLSHAGDGRLFRSCIVMLNTCCRPEAALDLAPAQINDEVGLVELNPEGRRQTKKFRPIVRRTDNLKGWLEFWKVPAEERVVGYADVDSLQSAITRARVEDEANLPEMVAYSLRHKMTSVLRRSGVPEDQIAVQLGHQRPNVRTTGLYGEFAPDYLSAAHAAIDAFLVRLQRLTNRPLFAPPAPTELPQTDASRTKRGLGVVKNG